MYSLLGTDGLNSFALYTWLKDTPDKLTPYLVNHVDQRSPLARKHLHIYGPRFRTAMAYLQRQTLNNSRRSYKQAIHATCIELPCCVYMALPASVEACSGGDARAFSFVI